jgi:hypothetical protein
VQIPTFQRSVLPPYSGPEKVRTQVTRTVVTQAHGVGVHLLMAGNQNVKTIQLLSRKLKFPKYMLNGIKKTSVRPQ